jgi:hypothetical protein
MSFTIIYVLQKDIFKGRAKWFCPVNANLLASIGRQSPAFQSKQGATPSAGVYIELRYARVQYAPLRSAGRQGSSKEGISRYAGHCARVSVRVKGS